MARLEQCRGSRALQHARMLDYVLQHYVALRRLPAMKQGCFACKRLLEHLLLESAHILSVVPDAPLAPLGYAGGGDHASRAGLHACSDDFAAGAKNETAAVGAGDSSVGDKSASVGAENAFLGDGQGRGGLAVTGQIGIDVAENMFSLWHTSRHPIS